MPNEREKLLQLYYSESDHAKRKAISTRILALDKGVADRVLEGPKQRVSDDMTLFAEGEINAGQLAGRALGETGQVFGEVLGTPVAAVAKGMWKALPDSAQDVLKKGAEDITQGIMETEAAQNTVSYLKANPEQARDLQAILGMSELIPGLSMLHRGAGGNFVNSVADNYKTFNKDWYSGNMGKKAKGALANVGGAVGAATKTAYSPKLRAIEDLAGTGARRIDEVLDPNAKKGIDVGNQIASGYIADQRGRTGTLAQETPIYKTAVLSETTAGDRDGMVKMAMQDNPNMPSAIAEDLVDRSVAALTGESITSTLKKGKAPGWKQVAEGVAASSMNVPGTGSKLKDTIVKFRDKEARTARTGAEALGTAIKTSKALSRLMSKEDLGRYARTLGKKADDLDINELQDYLHTSSLFEDASKKKLRAALPAEYKYATASELSPVYWAAKLKQNGPLTKKGEKPKLRKKQQAIVDAIDKVKREHEPNMLIEDVGGKKVIKYRTSYNSTEQELGGVGLAMTFDPETKTAYSVVLDGHDIFGADPAGGKGLWTLSPVQARQWGTDAPEPKPGQGGNDVPRIAQKERAAIEKLESMVPIKRADYPNTRDFEKAALEWARDNATPSLKNKIDAGRAGLFTVLGAIDLNRETENKQ